MTRIIERWFPCAEVSANSDAGWGSGNTERGLFTWFAARPSAQAKAAVMCSLLPWPDEPIEQNRLQDLVKRAMTGRYAAWAELRAEINKAYPDSTSVLDPFAGRGIIPLEAARLGLSSYAIDYAPMAVLASELLIDYPFRDWSNEAAIPFLSDTEQTLPSASQRLLGDVERVLEEIGRRHFAAMAAYYPEVEGKQPWGYLWAVTLPCRECGRRFPLVGSYQLRLATHKRGRSAGAVDDPGQSFHIEADASSGAFCAVVHDGPPIEPPTLTSGTGADGQKLKGKSAICPFCKHAHPLSVHQRLASEGYGRDALLLVADLDDQVGKKYRQPTDAELYAAAEASRALVAEQPFGPLLPAVPNEQIPPNNGATVRPALYGATTYGDLMCDRQTLSFVRLSRVIAELGSELVERIGVSPEYSRALAGYAAASLVRKIRRSTRGTTLDVSRQGVNHIYSNEGAVSFSYDFFEAGLGAGPGTWSSIIRSSYSTLRSLLLDARGKPGDVKQGTAADLPYRSGTMGLVVTDPPYDSMVYYTDSSDCFYVWLKRALTTTHPELAVTSDPRGLQDKADEIIVKEHGKAPGEHRDRRHYDARMAKAFDEMRRVVRHDGVVTIVFGHGEPEVWQRLLTALGAARLVMTGSWPANTEAGSRQGKASIETTLTMVCRPAPSNRQEGRKAGVEAEIKEQIKARYPDWERWGLAPADMLMAAAGPAMEIVGQYSTVRDARGESVDISTFLPIARAAVQEAMAVEIDHHPLDTFDARTRFALWWVRLYGRQIVAKSELRWQSLASSIDLADVRDLVPDYEKGCRFITTREFRIATDPESAVIDVAFAMAKASEEGLGAVGEVLLQSHREADDPYLWASIKFLVDRLPNSDPDAIAWTRLLRNRAGVNSAAIAAVVSDSAAAERRKEEAAQMRLFT